MATSTSPYGGRVQCILLSTVDGYVVYERFYDQFNDIQKAEIRTSFDDALGSNAVQNGLELTGRFKNGRVVGLCADEIIVFALGTGHCDELVLLELLERVVVVLKDVAKATVLTDLVLFEHYMDIVHVVDDMCKDVCSFCLFVCFEQCCVYCIYNVDNIRLLLTTYYYYVGCD